MSQNDGQAGQDIEHGNEQTETAARLALALSIELAFQKAVCDHHESEKFHRPNLSHLAGFVCYDPDRFVR